MHFSKFLEEILTPYSPAFKEFHAENRLNQFYFETVKVTVNYKVLSKILILVFTLDYGQAPIERGFSINSNMQSENMKEKSLVSRRTIKHFMVSNKLKAYQVEITIEMIKSVRNASFNYKTYLEENRKLQARKKRIIR